jgi:hypothetical protein
MTLRASLLEIALVSLCPKRSWCSKLVVCVWTHNEVPLLCVLHSNKWLCPLWSQSSAAWRSASCTYLWNADVALEEWGVTSACTSKYMPHPLQGLSWWVKDPVPAVSYWLWKRMQRHIRWHTGIVRVSLSQVLTPAATHETEHLVTRRIIF